MLELTSPHRPDYDLHHIVGMHDRYGDTYWGIIYQADFEMRIAKFERMKRQLAGEHAAKGNPTPPVNGDPRYPTEFHPNKP